MGRKTYGRVNIPHKPLYIVELAEHILKRHEEDGEASPLLVIDESLHMEEWAAIIEQAKQKIDEAEMLRGQAELATAERNKLLKDLIEKQRISSSYLKHLYAQNVQALGHWGFEVDRTPIRKKPKT